VYKDVLFTHEGRRKNPILSNEDSNISFYLYKIVKQCGTCGAFYLIFILNVRPFLYEIFFSLPEASSICLFGLMNGPAVHVKQDYHI
jgi:hypothetical protein